MKVTGHVEHLLRQGQKPSELVELGFPKSVVTRVRRRLREEKGIQRSIVAQGEGEVKGHHSGLAPSPGELAVTQQKLVSLESDLRKVESVIEALKVRLDNTPIAGVKVRFKCTQCGAQGLLATYIK